MLAVPFCFHVEDVGAGGRHLVDAKLAYIPESYDSILGFIQQRKQGALFCFSALAPTLYVYDIYIYILLLLLLLLLYICVLYAKKYLKRNNRPTEHTPCHLKRVHESIPFSWGVGT